MKYKHIGSLVGQNNIKKELAFYLDGYKKNSYYPSALFSASRGLGKSTVATKLAAELQEIEQKNGNGDKKLLTINAAELKNTDVFFSQIMPIVLEQGRITLFIDEVDEASLSIQKMLLTVLNPTDNKITEYYEANGNKHTFDFTKITVLMATTNAGGLHPDLLDRLRRFELEDYKPQELAHIIQTKLPGIRFVGGALENLSTTLRGNARQAIHRVNDIKTLGLSKIGDREWEFLKKTLSIYPLGLNKTEVRYLRELSKSHRVSLTDLCSRLSLTKDAVMGDVEVYPRKQQLVSIERSGRFITQAGRKVLIEIDKGE